MTNMRGAEAEVRELREKEDKLSRELAAIRSRTALVNDTYNQEARRLNSLDTQHSVQKQGLVEKHEKIKVQVNDWSLRCRTRDVVHERGLTLPELIDKRPAERQLKLPPLANLHLPREAPNNDDILVAIIDSNHTILDKLQHLGFSNERTTTISSRAVLQPIKLRNARRFFEDTRTSIYSFADGKGTGWIACMIQATGILQKKRCHGCSSNESPFEGCIAVGGHLFSKCGNCEWNGTSCQGLNPSTSTNMLAHMRPALEPPRSCSQLSTPGLILDPSLNLPAELEALAAAAPQATVKAYSSHYSPPQVHISGFKAANQTAKYEQAPPVPRAVPSLIASSRTSYRRSPKAPNADCSVPRPMAPICFRQMDFAAPNSNDITKETLVLRHNGIIYTHPDCIAGVPLEKITPSHPYWETKWPKLRSLTEPILRLWEEKLQSEEAASRVQKVGSVKYQYGRQVNRGNTILRFLEQGPISPYQLLAKKYVSVGKGSITSYDTLFRLCETIEALSNYKTDVEPVDWMRQHLHELITAQGSGFNFPKTIHDFYNDPKLAALRQKSGFKSIGRPSGIKMPLRRAESVDDDVPLTSSQRKRKSHPSYGTPSPRTEPPNAEPLKVDPVDVNQGPVGKKQKAAAKVLDSLETGEVSDADSVSGSAISEFDFRICQIKTRLFTSSEKVTQYWSWVPEKSMFEHQILDDRSPAGWSMQRGPIEFSLRLGDVVKISWNLKALRVYLVMSDRHICFEDDKLRGDIIVTFRRPNTMRRFIQFCRRREIELVEETWKKIEHLWGTMHSQ
ncbi:hypothetical protein ISF_09900 [Cordyceps fumosorosea ARSEF 2679]|uniref:Uncharacterized protein n=1 Tax=Cordyceps fumosorosea (strain ARSEF 2679) TaxID=1081104 RepID=A0A166ZL80_CORFA|nr:hypothetical protein ISF_09900 [Cordyceps fumosorosea ARSEF 2679]OAA38033.1 hypothetical protein ISF_09900 [Cordyceps fumosorosea ARSEF 2679]